MRSDELHELPKGLPVPEDDGACDHLRGLALPKLSLVSTSGEKVDLCREGRPWVIVYCYPRTGQPDREPPGGVERWNSIPGARGCTPQSCGYRDHHSELSKLGATILGLSSQSTEYQREAVERLRLPFALLSDERLELSRALKLPTFEYGGSELIRRLTLIIRAGRILEVLYPVFPPSADVQAVLGWIARQ